MKQPELSFQEVEERLPDFLLGTLAPEEMLAVLTHLEAQAELRQKLQHLEESMTALALSAPDVPLSPHVKTEFLAQVEADLRRETAPVSRPLPQAETHATFVEWLRQWWRRPGPQIAFVAGAMAVLVTLSIYTFGLSGRLDEARADLAVSEAAQAQLSTDQESLTADLIATQSENERLQRDLADAVAVNQALQNDLDQLQVDYTQVRIDEQQLQVVSYATHSVALQPHESYPGIRGFFYFGSPHEPALLVLHGLEQLPEGQVYQFWLVTPDGKQIPHETLQVLGPEAPTVETITLDEETPDFVAVGLTIEPAGGSPQPTGEMLLQGSS